MILLELRQLHSHLKEAARLIVNYVLVSVELFIEYGGLVEQQVDALEAEAAVEALTYHLELVGVFGVITHVAQYMAILRLQKEMVQQHDKNGHLECMY